MTQQGSSAAYMRNGHERVPVVCVGLSSGGLLPLRTIFRKLSPATGMTFVIIPHLSRTEPTILPEMLSHWSTMPAQLADPGLTIESNHIYVIPPGQEILVRDAHFGVRPRSKVRGWSNVITLFLDSLTEWRKPAGIAVILSGVDHDGAAALREFHSKGGITIAQDPKSANHNDMPLSAIGTGFVDYVLPPEAIATKIEQIARDGQDQKGGMQSAGES